MKILYSFILILVTILSMNCHSQEKDSDLSSKIIGYWSIGDHMFSIDALHLFPSGQFLYTVGYSGGAYHLEFYKGNYFYDEEASQIELSPTHRFLNSCMNKDFTCQPPTLFEVINSDSIRNISPYRIGNKTADRIITGNRPEMKRKVITKDFEQSQSNLVEDKLFELQWKVIPDSIK